MVEFHGTVKDFLKNYPKENRKVGETYRIINSKGSNDYQFIDNVSEKNFKRVEVKDAVNTEIDGAEMERQEDERRLSELKKLAERILSCAVKGDEGTLINLCEEVKDCTNITDLVCEENCAELNCLFCRQFYVDNSEVYWGVLNKKGIVDDICSFLNNFATVIKLNAKCVGREDLLDRLLQGSDVGVFARLREEWLESCQYVMECCKQSCGFDLRGVQRLNNLIYNFNEITDGWLCCLKEIVDDFAWFGETFKTCEDCKSYDYDPRPINVAKSFETFNECLCALYSRYGVRE